MYQMRKKRAAPKEHQISKALRKQIVEGELKPLGPNSPSVLSSSGYSRSVPSRFSAPLQHLIEDGFIYAKAGHGTFVVDHPPHLSRYGLVFPSHPNEREAWGNFYTALNNEALDLQRRRPGTLAIYYGMERPEHHQEREQLLQDVQAHRLAGLAFAYTPRAFRGTPILEEPRLARVAVMRNNEIGFPAVSLDGATLTQRAIDYLVTRGRKKLAIISSPGSAPSIIPTLARLAMEHGMACQSIWQHAVYVGAAEWARNIVHLMTQLPIEQRPDALFITDDNLVPHATAGLLAGGVAVPGDLDVVAHGNFPWLTPSVVPAKRIGFDARSVLAICMDTLDRQRKNIAVDQITVVPARLDEEVELPLM